MRGLICLEQGLSLLAAECRKWDKSKKPYAVIMPKIGCGIAGYDWETQIKPICDNYLKKFDITYCD